MASGSGKDQDDSVQREPDEPNSSYAAPSSASHLNGAPRAAAAGAGAGAVALSPRPARRAGRSQLRIGEQSGGGTSRDGTGSSAAAERKGKKVASPSPSSPSSSPSSNETIATASGADDDDDPFLQELAAIRDVARRWRLAEKKERQQRQEALGGKLTDKPTLQSRLAENPICRYLKNKVLGITGRLIFRPHVDWQTTPMNEAIHHYRVSPTEMATASLNVMNLPQAYSEFRPVLGDGECFYRSFMFSYLEQVLYRQDTREERRVLDSVERVATLCAHLGWTFNFSTSREAFEKLINKVMKWKRRWKVVASTNSYRTKKLLKFFNNKDKMKPIFVFLRLVAAVWICSHRDDYEQIITEVNEGCSLEEWCFQNVTRRREMVDHIPMMALTQALEVPLRVEVLRQGPAQDIYSGEGQGVPRVTLLYSGIHYDIIYPRNPSW